MTKKIQKKLVSFTSSEADLIKINQEVAEGWNIVSLTSNGGHYVGVMEKILQGDDASIFIPARKKIKIL